MSHVIQNNQVKKTTNPVISNLEIQIIEHDEILDNSDVSINMNILDLQYDCRFSSFSLIRNRIRKW